MLDNNCQARTGVLIKLALKKNEHVNTDLNFDLQISLSKRKIWYYKNCSHFSKLFHWLADEEFDSKSQTVLELTIKPTF
jgi:hypothetical protein